MSASFPSLLALLLLSPPTLPEPYGGSSSSALPRPDSQIHEADLSNLRVTFAEECNNLSALKDSLRQHLAPGWQATVRIEPTPPTGLRIHVELTSSRGFTTRTFLASDCESAIAASSLLFALSSDSEEPSPTLSSPPP